VTAPNTPETPSPDGEGASPSFQFTDKRKVTRDSSVVEPLDSATTTSSHQPARSDEEAAGSPDPALADAVNEAMSGLSLDDPQDLAAVRAERDAHLDSLQRERASFTNYRNRAIRDQEAARGRGVEDVLTALLPVLDDIERARTHDELTGPMAAIAEKIDASLNKFGIERYGAAGELFDPTLHDALMHRADEAAAEQTIDLVIEPGYRLGERVIRAARVGTVGPE